MSTCRAVVALWQRELVRFYRQRDRVVGALLTPVVFWLLLGLGLGRSFQSASAPGGLGYLEFFYAGTMVLIVLFTAIFSTISLIEDRREGFLQGVLVAPVGRAALVGGKVAGGATLATLQGLLFLMLAPLVKVKLAWAAVAWLVVTLGVLSVALTALGFVIAWRMESTQGFHAIMNLVLMPMWILSGAVFPPDGAARWLGWIMQLNPLSYGVTAVRAGLYWGEAQLPVVAFGITAGFAAVMCAVAWWSARQRSVRDVT
ncbi:MAG: ABC transporter permease [Verrucomicrobiae bacterium]|nr:ABC transporter permease [Verrucomicrobiae bacterium]